MARTPILSRRDWLKLSAVGALGASLSGWLPALAADTARNPHRKRSCILLWMNGGPSQMDTFDLKPGHANGGPFKETATNVPGIKISEHLPKIAKFGDRMAIVRGMSTKEGDHGRAAQFLHTGYLPSGPVQYPTLGSLVAKELADEESALPSFVSIDSFRAFGTGGSGFLGPQYAPLVLAPTNFQATDADYAGALRVPDLAPSANVTRAQSDARIGLLREMQKEFGDSHGGAASHSRATAYDRAVRLMQTDAAKAFDLDQEKAELRDRYGRNLFGQGCLLARRLVEQGVPFVEVALSRADGVPIGWDTHGENFDGVKRLSDVLDPAWATLMTDLKERGLLDTTLIVWMGEFGRTPKINGGNGRDHFPNAWTTVLAGGGIKGGQVVGKTSRDGMAVEERPVSVPDFLATVCQALGIDPEKQNQSNVGRPIRIVDKAAKPLEGVAVGK
jgi:uncharacterized protein (DUF1501 family)